MIQMSRKQINNKVQDEIYSKQSLYFAWHVVHKRGKVDRWEIMQYKGNVLTVTLIQSFSHSRKLIKKHCKLNKHYDSLCFMPHL